MSSCLCEPRECVCTSGMVDLHGELQMLSQVMAASVWAAEEFRRAPRPLSAASLPACRRGATIWSQGAARVLSCFCVACCRLSLRQPAARQPCLPRLMLRRSRGCHLLGQNPRARKLMLRAALAKHELMSSPTHMRILVWPTTHCLQIFGMEAALYYLILVAPLLPLSWCSLKSPGLAADVG